MKEGRPSIGPEETFTASGKGKDGEERGKDGLVQI